MYPTFRFQFVASLLLHGIAPVLAIATLGCVPTASVSIPPRDSDDLSPATHVAAIDDNLTAVEEEPERSTDAKATVTAMPQVSPLVIAVCPRPMQATLKPWVQRRTLEGLDVVVIDSQPTSELLQAAIEKAQGGRCEYIVLVGDTPPFSLGSACDTDRCIPTVYSVADVSSSYQETPQLPGDYRYGDFDSDGIVEAAVGRLPVQTTGQLRGLIERICRYEDSRDFGRWRSRVDLVAGVGGFGPMIDGAIEMVARGIITGSIPESVRTRITHASPTSLYHPGADAFTETVLRNYQDGARFWVYAGHGWITELDRVPATYEGRPVLAAKDMNLLRSSPENAPIALMLACYTGAFDAHENCLAETMLLADQGPIAVLAGSRVTMPYGNASAAISLIHAVYERKSPRLGDAWQMALQEMATPTGNDNELRTRRMMIDGIASLVGGGGKMHEERLEHMQLYNWLGDPTLRLGLTEDVIIGETKDATFGQLLQVRGRSPIAGELVIELHRRAGSTSGALETGKVGYDQANDTVIANSRKRIESGDWQIELQLPPNSSVHPESSVPVVLKADVAGKTGFASGSRSLWLRQASSKVKQPELSARPPAVKKFGSR